MKKWDWEYGDMGLGVWKYGDWECGDMGLGVWRHGIVPTSNLRVAGFPESGDDNIPPQDAVCHQRADIGPQLLESIFTTGIDPVQENTTHSPSPPSTDRARQTDGQTDGRTDGQTDRALTQQLPVFL